jgi:AAA+ superfamily predicted ATPase
LLHGPNQNGKTTLAYSLVHKYKNNFFHISSPALYDQYTDGYVDIIDSLIDPLTSSNEPAVVILEAIHVLCRLEKIKDHPDRRVAQYLLQKLKFAHIFNPHLLIIGITDSPDELSSDYQDYFENSTYQIKPPSREKRYSVIKSFLFKHGFFEEKTIQKIVYETRNLPLGHIDKGLHMARMHAEIDAIKQNRPPKRLTLNHIDTAFEAFFNGKHLAKTS